MTFAHLIFSSEMYIVSIISVLCSFVWWYFVCNCVPCLNLIPQIYFVSNIDLYGICQVSTNAIAISKAALNVFKVSVSTFANQQMLARQGNTGISTFRFIPALSMMSTMIELVWCNIFCNAGNKIFQLQIVFYMVVVAWGAPPKHFLFNLHRRCS